MVGEECEKNGDKRKIRLSNHDIWCEDISPCRYIKELHKKWEYATTVQ